MIKSVHGGNHARGSNDRQARMYPHNNTLTTIWVDNPQLGRQPRQRSQPHHGEIGQMSQAQAVQVEYQQKPCQYNSAVPLPQEQDHNLPAGRKLLVDHQRKRKRPLISQAVPVMSTNQRSDYHRRKFWEDSHYYAGFNPTAQNFMDYCMK